MERDTHSQAYIYIEREREDTSASVSIRQHTVDDAELPFGLAFVPGGSSVLALLYSA